MGRLVEKRLLENRPEERLIILLASFFPIKTVVSTLIIEKRPIFVPNYTAKLLLWIVSFLAMTQSDKKSCVSRPEVPSP